VIGLILCSTLAENWFSGQVESHLSVYVGYSKAPTRDHLLSKKWTLLSPRDWLETMSGSGGNGISN
jgi:hypothetical protein